MQSQIKGGARAEDICIICMYKKQIEAVKGEIRKLKVDVKVGTVDSFQGSERKHVHVLTTRTSETSDIRRTFLTEQRRTNV